MARFYSAKRRLPTLLKLRGDQAIVRIAGSVTPFRERSFISNLLQLELCGLVEARVIDMDGVYDPCRPNDRLLLGMNGMVT